MEHELRLAGEKSAPRLTREQEELQAVEDLILAEASEPQISSADSSALLDGGLHHAPVRWQEEESVLRDVESSQQAHADMLAGKKPLDPQMQADVAELEALIGAERKDCIEALLVSNGDVNAAATRLLGLRL